MYNPQLVTFLKVTETGSFTSAARELYITPSAVAQQISLLERDLKVRLFKRTKQGVLLTEAGSYLAGQANAYIRQGDQIRAVLERIEASGQSICVGTSLMEKCRLLYDLWILFYQKYQKYDVRMINIDTDRNALAQAELVECVKDNAPWQEGWEFFEICSVPMGIAVAKDHALARYEMISPEDLKKTTVVLIERGMGALKSPLENLLVQMEVPLDYRRECGSSLIWECSVRKMALLVPLCWDDVLFDLQVKPCRWDYSLPYGIFYKKDASEPAMQFVSFIRNLYAGKEETAAIPVL